MERITYPLKHPIETIARDHAGVESKTTIAELKLAPRVKGRHMRGTDKATGPMEAKLMLIASLANITRAEADELDQDDVFAIDDLYDEDSDRTQLAHDLGLPAEASLDTLRAAIAELKAPRGLEVPLDGGAGPSADGPETGPTLSVT